MSAPRWCRSDYITYTCHHVAEVSRTTHYSNEICDKLKTTQTSQTIPFHLILVLFKRTLFPEYIPAYQKNTRMPRMHLFLIFLLK